MADPNPEIARIGLITEKSVLGGGPTRLLLQITRTEYAESAVVRCKICWVAHCQSRQAMHDSDPTATFSHMLHELNRFHLAYAHIVVSTEDDLRHGAVTVDLQALHGGCQGQLSGSPSSLVLGGKPVSTGFVNTPCFLMDTVRQMMNLTRLLLSDRG
jgi:hypothetical protein